MTTAVQRQPQGEDLAVVLRDAIPQMRELAPRYVKPERLVALALAARKVPALAQCSKESVLEFCMTCAKWGADRIGAGGVWPVPYRNNKLGTTEMMAVADWRFIIERLKRAGAIKHATAEAVYESDMFDYVRGTSPMLTHKPALRDRGDLVAVYCVYTLPDDTKDFVVMDMEEDIEPIRLRSKAKDSGPWVTDMPEMAKKTVIKRALKTFEGASIELSQMLENDNLVTGYDDSVISPPSFAMPKPRPALPEDPTPAAPPAAKEPAKRKATAKPAAEPKQADGDVEVVEGVVEVIAKKKMSNGGTRWGIKIGDVWYNTFDDGLAEGVKKGQEATLYYQTNAKGFHDLVEPPQQENPASEPDPAPRPGDREYVPADEADTLFDEGEDPVEPEELPY